MVGGDITLPPQFSVLRTARLCLVLQSNYACHCQSNAWPVMRSRIPQGHDSPNSYQCTKVASNGGTTDIARMKTVAIIGASNNRAKFGNKAVRAFVQQGCMVYPVNPNE